MAAPREPRRVGSAPGGQEAEPETERGAASADSAALPEQGQV